MTDTHKLLQRLWRAWQYGVAPADKPQWMADCKAFVHILQAIRTRTEVETEYAELAALITSSKDRAWDALRREEGVKVSLDQVIVYRGLKDAAAQDARLGLRLGQGVVVSDDSPLSYSLTPAAALGFARKGATAGLVYAARISLADLAFFDIWQLSQSNLAAEREVVVWHNAPLIVPPGDVCNDRVSPGASTATSQRAAAEYRQLAQDLAARWTLLCKENGLDEGAA